jgi:hypothetical protein
MSARSVHTRGAAAGVAAVENESRWGERIVRGAEERSPAPPLLVAPGPPRPDPHLREGGLRERQ